MEIAVLKDQAKLNSCLIRMRQDLSLLEKLLMPRLFDSIECYLLENNLGSPKAWYCQKLQVLLEEEITIYI